MPSVIRRSASGKSFTYDDDLGTWYWSERDERRELCLAIGTVETGTQFRRRVHRAQSSAGHESGWWDTEADVVAWLEAIYDDTGDEWITHWELAL